MFGVCLAAAGLGRVGVSSCLPSELASGIESVEVELYFHSLFEGDVYGLEGSLGVLFVGGSVVSVLVVTFWNMRGIFRLACPSVWPSSFDSVPLVMLPVLLGASSTEWLLLPGLS